MQIDITDESFGFPKTAQPGRADMGAFDHSTFKFEFAPGEDSLGFGVDLKRASGKEKQLMDFKKGTTTLAFRYKGGIIVAVDSRASMGTFNSSETVRKIIEVNDYILGTMAGGAADCQFWDAYIAKEARQYYLQHGEKMTVAGRPSRSSSCFEVARQHHVGIQRERTVDGCHDSWQ